MRRPDPAFLRLLFFVGGLAASITLLIVFRDIFQPLLLGLLVAYLLDPAVSWFERHGRSRVFGVVAISLVLVAVLTLLVLFVAPAIDHQIEVLSKRLPEYQERLRVQMEPWLERLRTRYPEEIDQLQARAVQGLRENLPKLATVAGHWMAGVFGSLMGFVLFLLNLVFVPVFAFYLLVDLPKLRDGLSGLIPLPYREIILDRLREVNDAIASFLRGQLTIALVLAAINATGLMLLGVPFGLGLGILAGLANMIPYMALVVGLVPALALAWAEHQSWAILLGVAAVFTGAQLLEGTVLSPRILSRSVNLHPVWVLLAVIAGGSLFGFIGMLIAVPVAAAIHVFVRHWVKLYKRSKIYLGEAVEGAGSEASEPAGDDVPSPS